MKYALLNYTYTNSGYINFGDHIQSLAAKQYLPKVDFLVDREKLNGKFDKAKIIMNGWYTHVPENWPPNENLETLFLSFHLNPVYADRILSKKENIEYLKKHSPIGCRDYKTQEILESYGIESYYSFCLTSTLGNTYKSNEKNDDIIFNDVIHKFLPSKIKKEYKANLSLKNSLIGFASRNYNKIIKKSKRDTLLKSYFPESIIDKASYYEQMIDENLGTEGLFTYAEDMLNKYAKAKLVVTSRIHCAIPCLALETPVLFVMDGVENPKADISRFNGVLDHINILSTKPRKEINLLFGKQMNVINPNDIDFENPPSNPTSHLKYKNDLIDKCTKFIN